MENFDQARKEFNDAVLRLETLYRDAIDSALNKPAVCPNEPAHVSAFGANAVCEFDRELCPGCLKAFIRRKE